MLARKQIAAVAIAAAAHLTGWPAFGGVPTCDDLIAALNASDNFSKWRGQKIGENEWETSHKIFTFNKCVISKNNFRCSLPAGSSLERARSSYSSARDLVENCLSKSESGWVFDRRADPLASMDFVNRDGRNGVVGLINLGFPKPAEEYWLQLTVLEHF